MTPSSMPACTSELGLVALPVASRGCSVHCVCEARQAGFRLFPLFDVLAYAGQGEGCDACRGITEGGYALVSVFGRYQCNERGEGTQRLDR